MSKFMPAAIVAFLAFNGITRDGADVVVAAVA
jgi:hypothetical protein